MNQEWKGLIASLYDQFGDQGINWAKDHMVSYLSEPHLGGSAPRTDDAQAEPETATFEGARETETAETGPLAGVDYGDGDAFAAQLQTEIGRRAAAVVRSPEEFAGVVQDIILMAGEVRKFEEVQITKRVGIAAERDIAIEGIRAKKDILEEYLNRSFDERAENFSRLFDVVDGALDTGNMQALALGLESVVKLAASSPFKDLRTVEETSAALTDPGHEWDF